MDLGFRSETTGFLPFSELPSEVSAENLIAGQVLLVRVQQNQDLKVSFFLFNFQRYLPCFYHS